MAFQLPWISYAAIKELNGYLKPYHQVVEFGGGGSTTYFAKRVQHVLCIESSREWAADLKQQLDTLNINNVSIELHEFDARDASAYANSSNLAALKNKMFDVILVDGYEEDVELRPTCFWYAENHIKEGGIIILDDSWRYPAVKQTNRAKYWREYKSIGPCRPGITTTNIYFY